MDNYSDACNPEKINKIKEALYELKSELDKIGNVDFKILSDNFGNINRKINFYCLTYLGAYNESANYLSMNLQPAAARLGIRQSKLAKSCIPHIENVLNYLENEYEQPESESESEPEPESEPDQKPSLFPSHKYLNLSDKNEFPQVKSEYRKLALLYHPDKCKIEGMTKEQCENEFKILDNEYKTIKTILGITGGKKTNKNRKTKKLHNIKRKRSIKRKKIIKSKKNYRK